VDGFLSRPTVVEAGRVLAEVAPTLQRNVPARHRSSATERSTSSAWRVSRPTLVEIEAERARRGLRRGVVVSAEPVVEGPAAIVPTGPGVSEIRRTWCRELGRLRPGRAQRERSDTALSDAEPEHWSRRA
jgi:hypothetical protein